MTTLIDGFQSFTQCLVDAYKFTWEVVFCQWYSPLRRPGFKWPPGNDQNKVQEDILQARTGSRELAVTQLSEKSPAGQPNFLPRNIHIHNLWNTRVHLRCRKSALLGVGVDRPAITVYLNLFVGLDPARFNEHFRLSIPRLRLVYLLSLGGRQVRVCKDSLICSEITVYCRESITSERSNAEPQISS